jgi:hypothetical protein
MIANEFNLLLIYSAVHASSACYRLFMTRLFVFSQDYSDALRNVAFDFGFLNFIIC